VPKYYVREYVNILSVRSVTSLEDKSTDQEQEETRAVEDRGSRDHASSTATSKTAGSRRAGRQQVRESRKKSPTGKGRSGRHTSPTSDVITPASDADARYCVLRLQLLSCLSSS